MVCSPDLSGTVILFKNLKWNVAMSFRVLIKDMNP